MSEGAISRDDGDRGPSWTRRMNAPAASSFGAAQRSVKSRPLTDEIMWHAILGRVLLLFDYSCNER